MVKAKFFGVLQRTLNGRPVYVTDREKALVDAADPPELSGGSLQLAQVLQAAQPALDWPRLDDYLQRWPNTGPLKRLGYLVETLALSLPDREERLARSPMRCTSFHSTSRVSGRGASSGPTVKIVSSCLRVFLCGVR